LRLPAGAKRGCIGFRIKKTIRIGMLRLPPVIDFFRVTLDTTLPFCRWSRIDRLQLGSDQELAEAKKNGWTVISMRDDWKKIFAFEDGKLR
jgi:hypothetical protein